MIKIYQYHSQGFGCMVQVSYSDGVLCDVKIENPVLDTEWHAENMPDKKAYFFAYENGFLAATNGKTKVTEVKRDITFEMFWEKYNHKLAGRFKTEKKWNTMSASERLAAFDHIQVYEGQLKLNPVAKMYATTYLNEKRWIK